MPEPHTVEISCKCDDIEQCRLERYVSDVRILTVELEGLKEYIEHLHWERKVLWGDPSAKPARLGVMNA